MGTSTDGASVAGEHGHEHGRREGGRAQARMRTARGWASTGADADGARMAGEHGFERGRRRVAGKHGLRETGGEHGDLPFFFFLHACVEGRRRLNRAIQTVYLYRIQRLAADRPKLRPVRRRLASPKIVLYRVVCACGGV